MRVLVLGAGGPAGVNVCRALDAAGHEVRGSDDVPIHLEWAEPYLDGWVGYNDLDYNWLVDVVMAQPDPLVMRLADREPYTRAKRFLPKPQTIALCQDKFECGLAWRRAGLREDKIYLMERASFEWGVEPQHPYWLRARHGAGAKAAICARTHDEADHWMAFWEERDRSVEFIGESFLPGRDFSWCGIYREGELVASFARERLEYLYPNLTPEGITGTPTRARIVHSGMVGWVAQRSVLAVDEEPHGVFCVDLREDANGVVRPTEINAGRFSTTVGLWSIYSERSNFVALAAELAVEDESRLEDWEDLPEGLTLSRHIDCGHVFSGAKVPA